MKGEDGVRKSKAAAETRARIVQGAAVEFRRNGIDRTGLNEVMGAAGLTHGGFYKHFASKEQVIAEACTAAADSLTRVLSAVADTTGGKGRLDAAVGSYPCRDEPGESCPLATLGSELARHDDVTRQAATEGFLKLTRPLAAEIPEADPEIRRQSAIVTMCAMIGALTMSRVVDESLSDTILSETRHAINTGRLRKLSYLRDHKWRSVVVP